MKIYEITRKFLRDIDLDREFTREIAIYSDVNDIIEAIREEATLSDLADMTLEQMQDMTLEQLSIKFRR